MTNEERKAAYDAKMAELQEKYKDVLAKCYDFSVGFGWLEIVERALDICQEYNRVKPADEMPVSVVQIKEKFGGLRFYADHGSDAVGMAISAAEAMSYKTCEVCGSHDEEADVKTGGEGWIATLCKDHREW